MEKLGMRREGHFRESVLLANGKWHDEYYYAITDKEWFEKQPYHEPRTKPQRPPDLTSARKTLAIAPVYQVVLRYVSTARLQPETN
jgi:hypothetical protein